MRFPAARPRKTCDSVPLKMLLSPPTLPSLAVLTRQTEITLVSPRSLPSSVHFDGARSACAATNSRKTQHFLEQLFQSQPAIEVVRSSWDQFPEDSFAGKSRQQVEAICLRKGLFADFVREFRDTAQVANSQMRWSADGELRKQLPTVVNLLNQWAKRIGGNTSQHQPAAQDQYPETDNHEVDTQKPQKTPAARS